MKLEKVNNGEIQYTCETELEQLFINNILDERQRDATTIEALKKNLLILADDNGYLKKLLRDNNIEFKEEWE